jgi:acetyl esterase
MSVSNKNQRVKIIEASHLRPDTCLQHNHLQRTGRTMSATETTAVVLEPAAQDFADATANPPYLFDLLPVTDASFDTTSCHQFAEGYFLRRDATQWFWDQYTTDQRQRADILASPLRATPEQLSGLPRTLVITSEADILRDEGEAYARKLRAAGVDITAVRYAGIIHDFVTLNALRATNAAENAIAPAITYLRQALS